MPDQDSVKKSATDKLIELLEEIFHDEDKLGDVAEDQADGFAE